MKRRLYRILRSNTYAVFLYNRLYTRLASRLRLVYYKLFRIIYSEDDLIKQFKAIGLKPKDKVMIHSAATKIGLLEKGSKTLVNALKTYITEEGLIIMPTFPHRNSYNYLENYTLFDVNSTPSMNGSVTECFRKSDNVYRSLHPTHPLAAWGKDAEVFMRGHEYSKSMFDKDSPFKKIIDANVKLLLIGVNFDHLTIIRAIDDLNSDFPIKTYCDKTYKVQIKGYHGELINVETTCHHPKYLGEKRDNMRLFPYLKNKIKFGKLGNANTWLFNSKDMYEQQEICLANKIYFFNDPVFKHENL